MAEYKIAITNRIASVEGGVELVCNNPTDSIRFVFDEEWSGVVVKTARFSWEGKYIDVPFSGNVVQIPEIFHTNYVYVGVFTDELTTTPAKVACRFSIKCLGGKVAAPTEDVYNEIIALVNAAASDVSDLKNYAAQPFETSGNIVQLDNYSGMPMNCQTHIDFVQEGSGDPSPDNVRPIVGFDSATLTHNESMHTADFGQTVCAGEIDWNTGVLTVDRKLLTLTGGEVWTASSLSNAYYVGSNSNPNMGLYNIQTSNSGAKPPHDCSHYKAARYATPMANNTVDIFAGTAGNTIRFRDDRCTSLDAWVTYVQGQHAAGTPVQVACALTRPVTIQLAPAQIAALQGTNYIWSDVGETTVSGRKDILWLTDYLIERIKTLETAIISTGGNV